MEIPLKNQEGNFFREGRRPKNLGRDKKEGGISAQNNREGLFLRRTEGSKN
jgi:hypothetical protein